MAYRAAPRDGGGVRRRTGRTGCALQSVGGGERGYRERGYREREHRGTWAPGAQAHEFAASRVQVAKGASAP